MKSAGCPSILDWEAAVIATPRFPADVHFIVGSFPDLFGTSVGAEVQRWCINHGWLLMWSLGKNGDTSRDRAAPGFAGNHRLIDPVVAASVGTNLVI